MLGLRDGQIVRPVVEIRNDRLTLLLEGRVVEWPGAPQSGAAEDAAPLPARWVVRLLPNGSAQLVPMRGQEAAAAPPPLAAKESAQVLPPRWSHLLQRPGAGHAWMALLRPTSMPAGEMVSSASRGVASATSTSMPLPTSALVSMGLLDGVSLRDAVRRSGLFAEARLARGELVDLTDIKLALLARLRNRANVPGPERATMSSALDDIEAAQLQTLAASSDGGLALNLVLGFRDAPALSMRWTRDGPQEDPAHPPLRGWTVDMSLHSETWGQLWLQARVEADGRIGLVMWSDREDLCFAAGSQARRLSALLNDAGLRLDGFQVIHGTRRDGGSDATAQPAGSVVDLRA